MKLVQLVFSLLLLTLSVGHLEAGNWPSKTDGTVDQPILTWVPGTDYDHTSASVRQPHTSQFHLISQYKDSAFQLCARDWSLTRNVSLNIQLNDSFCRERKAEQLFPDHDFW